MKKFTMPSRTLDYILMGIIAGVIAGIILVYIAGITYLAILETAETLRNAFKIVP
jgi:hypothetical protein